MLFYIFLYLLVFSCLYIKKDFYIVILKKRYSFPKLEIAFIILFIISSIRYNIGYDYQTYWHHIENLAYNSDLNTEYISKYIFWYGHEVNNPQIVFVIYSAIIITGFYIGIKELCKNKEMATLIFVSLFYIESFSTIRQWAAAAVLFASFKFVKEKKLVKYLICVCIATFIHKYAFLGVLIWVVYNANILYVSVILLALTIFSKAVIKYLADKVFIFAELQRYITYEGSSGQMWMLIMFIFLFFETLILLYAKKDETGQDYKDISLYYKICLIGAFAPLIFGSANGHRFSYYFNQFICVLLPMCCEKYGKICKILIQLALLLIFVMYLYITTKNGNAYIPFRTIWDK